MHYKITGHMTQVYITMRNSEKCSHDNCNKLVQMKDWCMALWDCRHETTSV